MRSIHKERKNNQQNHTSVQVRQISYVEKAFNKITPEHLSVSRMIRTHTHQDKLAINLPLAQLAGERSPKEKTT